MRKHFVLLAVLVLGALRRSGLKGFRALSLAYVLCLVYVLTDEIHQIFILGRAWGIDNLVRDC